MPAFDSYSSWLSPTNDGGVFGYEGDSSPEYSSVYDSIFTAGDWWNDAAGYGYDGAMPAGETGDSTNLQIGDPRKDAYDWMKRSGYTYKVNPTQRGGQQNAWFNPQGQMIPGSYKEFTGGDPMFSLASSIMGAAGGQFVGGLAGLGSLSSGALSGGMSAGAQDADLGSIMKGAAQGGLASYTPSVSKYVGANGTLGKIIDGAAKGGVQSAIGGGNIGRGAATGGVMAGLNSLGGSNMDGGYSRAPWDTGPSPSFSEFQPQQSAAPWSTPTLSFPSDSRAEAPQQDFWQSNPLGRFVTDTLGSPQRLGDLVQGGLGMYSGYRRNREAKKMRQQLSGNRDSYLANLRNELRARDAASGRRSNYAGRETQLQAKLAELDSRNAPYMSALSDAQFGGLEQMFASGLRMGGNMGAFGPSYMRQGQQPQMPQYTQPAPLNNDFSLDPQRRTRLGY